MNAIKVGVALAAVAVLAGPVLAADAEWKQEVAAGYDQVTGNTKNSKLNASYEGLRKTGGDELTLKASTLYSSQNNKMDGQKHAGSARYAPIIGDSDWYNFYKIEADHDRFASIDYRVLPSVGAGYWFSDTEDWKAQAEVGLGYEYTNYNDNTDKEAITLIPRGYAEKAVFENARVSEELIYYPSLERADTFRARSETRFTNALSETLALRASYVFEHDSAPLSGKKKNDTQLIIALVYSF